MYCLNRAKMLGPIFLTFFASPMVVFSLPNASGFFFLTFVEGAAGVGELKGDSPLAFRSGLGVPVVVDVDEDSSEESESSSG